MPVCSTRQEPLGHTVSRGYKLPAGLGTEVPFGCSLQRVSHHVVTPGASTGSNT
jgi:hypothetical protein